MDAWLAPLSVLLLFASATGIGLPVVRKADQTNTLNALEGALLAVLVGAVIIAGLVWIIGAWSYTTTTMSLLLLACGLACGIGYRRFLRSGRDWLPALPAGKWRLLLVAIGVILAVGLVGSYAPPSDHDTLRYHLTLPHRDLAWGIIAVYPGWSVYEFSPPLGGLLTRLVYAISGPTGAQLLHLMWQVVAAGTAAAIARRLGLKAEYCWLAALLLLSQRLTINLASSASIEFVLVAYAGGAIMAARFFTRNPTFRSAVLFGLVVGGMFNVKLHGLIFAACLAGPLLFAAVRGKIPVRYLITAAATAVLLFAPLMIQNAVITGNPFFPAFNQWLGNTHVDLFGIILEISRTKANVQSLLLLPWNLFVDQNRFDGLQFGLPTLLVFLPFAFFVSQRARLYPLIAIVVFYLAFWLLLMPQFIRFLAPLFPLLCAMAACGAAVVGQAVADRRRQKQMVMAIALALAVGQLGFLAATAARRVPPALGLVSAQAYLNSTPFQWYAQYDACKWTLEHLQDDETYLAALNSPTYYCPPERAISQLLAGDEARIYTSVPRAPVAADWLARQLVACKVRYVLMAGNLGTDSEPLVFAKHRYDDLLLRIKPGLQPIHEISRPSGKGALASIYDGRDVVAALDTLATSTEPSAIDNPQTAGKSGECQLQRPYRKLRWPTYN